MTDCIWLNCQDEAVMECENCPVMKGNRKVSFSPKFCFQHGQRHGDQHKHLLKVIAV